LNFFFFFLSLALLLAPFFVFVEVLFMLGYRPKLAKMINDNAVRDIKKWKDSLAKKAK